MSNKDSGDGSGRTPNNGSKSSNDNLKAPAKWEKGGPSPNPRGPYHRKHTKSLLATLDPYAAAILENERRETGSFNADGAPNTFGSVFRSSLLVNASKDPKYAAIYERASAAAHHAEGKRNEEVLDGALKHRHVYLAEFIDREQKGLRRLPIWPDPRDVVVCNMEVHVVGPMDAEEQQVVDAAVKMRNLLLKGIKSIVIDAENVERRDAIIIARNYLRRRLYRLNILIPPRLKKRIPPLVDHTRSAWDDDDETCF